MAVSRPAASRRFVHVCVEQGGLRVVIPLVAVLHPEDVAVLSALWDDALDEVCGVLALHAGVILPVPEGGGWSGPGGPAAATSTSRGAAKRGQVTRRVFHAETVSCWFEVKVADASYIVLTGRRDDGSGDGGDGGDGDGGGDGSGAYDDVPVASYRLYAHVRHKASEVERRRKALLASAMTASAGAVGPTVDGAASVGTGAATASSVASVAVGRA